MRDRPRALISACLLGVPCRYDGASKPIDPDRIARLMDALELIPVCPEQLGGLPTPRTPSERVGPDAVMDRNGLDVTPFFRCGADIALMLAGRFHATLAVLKARSPSCGAGEIYDGSFSGKTIPGDGMTTAALRGAGILVYTEDQIDALLRDLEEMKS